MRPALHRFPPPPACGRTRAQQRRPALLEAPHQDVLVAGLSQSLRRDAQLDYADLVVRVLVAAGQYRPRLGWHTFRHTYARDYLLLGGELGQLQKALGHGSIQTTQKYYDHFTPDDAQNAAHRKIYPDAKRLKLA
ncbi:MAG: tyrosine-type recombinase/integrase [Thioalkalivibrio sp.]|nr:tyrosine-type recombinase/integrase [Thioalkalivibrio sp.]